jgi:hypothetical protein
VVCPVAGTSATVEGTVTPDAEQPDTAMYSVVRPSLSFPTHVVGRVGLVNAKLPPPVDVVTATSCQ